MSRELTPVLTLLVEPDPPASLTPLLVAMLPWCTPKAADAAIDAVAVLATGPAAPGLTEASRRGIPLAIWVRTDDEAADARALRPRALLTESPSVASATDALLIDGAAAPVDHVPWIPPFVRARIRRQGGLPDIMVLDVRSDDFSEDVLPTALGACSACIAPGRHLLHALAWGAPTVTTPAAVAALGLHPGNEALTGEEHELVAIAEDLGRDERQAARLSRAGRRFAERRGLRFPASTLAGALGLAGAGTRSVLEALSAPVSAAEPDIGQLIRDLDAGSARHVRALS